MKYENFVEHMRREVEKYFQGECCVTTRKMLKNNGVERVGINIAHKDVNIAPTIYLEDFFEEYKKGVCFQKLKSELILYYEKVKVDESWSGEYLKEYEEVKEKIIYKLLHYEKNKEMLEDMPHFPYLDLAIVFYVYVDEGMEGRGVATMPIHREHLEWWDISVEELLERAMENTSRYFTSELEGMNKFTEAMFGDEEKYEEEIMYILSNSIHDFGATVILYEGVLENVGDYLGENYMIIPSSVHEVLVMPERYACEPAFMKQVIAEVNQHCLTQEEYLSDSLYYYDRESRQVSIL